MDAEQRSRLHALLQWHQGLLDGGVPAQSLPLESDLERIAEHPQPELFDKIGLVRYDAVRSFRPGILNTIRTADQATAAMPPGVPDAAPYLVGAHSAAAEQVATMPPRERPARSSRRSRPSAVAEMPTPEAPADAGADPTPAAAEIVGFAPRDTTTPLDESMTTLRSLQVTQAGELAIRWDGVGTESAAVVYRVITSEVYMPFSPETGDLLAVASGTEVIDRRPFTGALRHVQVWVNRGQTENAARQSQPALLCQGTAVAPVANVDLREEQGWVNCAWDLVPAGIARVEVLRIPEEDAGRPGYLPKYLITGGLECRAGFQDAGCEPGATYEYRIFTVAEVAGGERMSSVSRRIRISAPLQRIDDLHATTRGVAQRTVVDLTWTGTGHGEVRIYRTDTGPDPGAEDVHIPVSALASARLPETGRLIEPVSRQGDVCRITGIAWPTDWSRVYFTPVTADQGRACIGTTQALSQAGEIRDVRLIQRVDWQLLTLGWPGVASQVQIFLTPRGVPLADPPGEPVAQLDRTGYENHGGLRLRGLLPDKGCDVHVIPVTYYGGRIIRGSPATVGYAGIVRLQYRLDVESTVRNRLLGRPSSRLVEVYSEQIVSTPRLVLVYNDQRLPLDLRDGTQKMIAPTPVGTGQWTVVDRFPSVRDRPGYFRLFADVDPQFPADFAVLDPPLSSLRGDV